jgi:hypothetical protein
MAQAENISLGPRTEAPKLTAVRGEFCSKCLNGVFKRNIADLDGSSFKNIMWAASWVYGLLVGVLGIPVLPLFREVCSETVVS